MGIFKVVCTDVWFGFVCFFFSKCCLYFSILVSFNGSDSLVGLSLVVICSSENEDRAHMAAALDQYRLGTIPHCASPKEIRQYLKTQFKPSSQQRGKFRDQTLPWTSAAVLDKEEYVVFNGTSLTF